MKRQIAALENAARNGGFVQATNPMDTLAGLRAAAGLDPGPAVGSALDMQRASNELNQALYGGGAVNVAPLTIAGQNADMLVADIVNMARKKDGGRQIRSTLMAVSAASKYEGERARDEQATSNLKTVQRVVDEKIVCSFLAEVDVNTKLYNGLPPDQVWTIASYTLVKIVDALNRAGYTPRGRVAGADRVEKREALMGKAHSDSGLGLQSMVRSRTL